MTGAPMPSGADSVVPIEWTDGGTAHGPDLGAPRARPSTCAGSARTSREGDLLLEEGTRARPARGRAAGRRRARPGAGAAPPTGGGAVDGQRAARPGQQLGYDSIYDSNSYLLAAAVRAAGAIPYRVGAVGDDPHVFSDALSDQLVRADVVVTSGGVSKGAYDVVKDVLSRLGTVEFCEVAMQPGKPQGFGRVGEDQTPIFTLPGNPVSSYVSFEVFVVPALRRLIGRLPYRRPLVQATLTDDVPSPAGTAQYLRGAVRGRPPGRDRDAGGRRRFPPAGRAGTLQCARRARRGRHRGRCGRDGVGAGARPRLLRSDGTVWTMADRRWVHPPGRVRRGADGRRVGQGGDGAYGDRERPGAGLGRGAAAAARRAAGCPRVTRSAVARIAGIMAAKRTPDLVPLCHPIAVSRVEVDARRRRRRGRDHAPPWAPPTAPASRWRR